MGRFLIVLCLFFTIIHASAQERFYIFIQSEAPGSFFVKKENKIFNSSPGGYIIISGLANVKHEFSIGFTNSSEPEKFFDLHLKGKDRSFLLKKFDNKIWGLYDLQDLSITHALKSEPGFQLKPSQEVSSFTNLLVKASGDSSLKYTAVIANKEAAKQVVKNDPANISKNENLNPSQVINPIPPGSSDITNNALASGEPGIITQKDSLIIVQTKDTLNNQNTIEPKASTKAVNDEKEKKEIGRLVSISETENDFKVSQVLKISESLTQAGLGIVYQEIIQGGKIDTIRILIDDLEEINKPLVTKQEDEKESTTAKNELTEEMTVKIESKNDVNTKPEKTGMETTKETITSKVLKFLNIGSEKETAGNDERVTSSGNKSSETISNRCKDNFTEKELTKLRNKMALAVTDEAMIAESKILLNNSCITSSQVKRLSQLFGTNAGKFSFFKSVYPSVSDKQYFYTLKEQLTDEHYNSRFSDILQSE